MKKKYNFITFLVTAKKYTELTEEVQLIASNTKIRHYKLKNDHTDTSEITSENIELPSSPLMDDSLEDYINSISDFEMKENENKKEKEIEVDKEKEDSDIIPTEEFKKGNGTMKYFCLPMVDLIIFPSINGQFEDYGEVASFNYFKNKKDDNKW